jgi:hypothetical protein
MGCSRSKFMYFVVVVLFVFCMTFSLHITCARLNQLCLIPNEETNVKSDGRKEAF